MAYAVLSFLQLLFLALVAVAPGTFATSSWSLCDSKPYPITVKGVTVVPDPVVSGSEANFRVPATTDQEIQGGTVIITVYFHSIPVHSERDDLCAKTKCPIKPGDFVLENSEVLPKITPPGSYKIKLQVVDKSGGVLACAYVNFEIVWRLAEGDHSVRPGVPSIVQHSANQKPFALAEK
eukprot:TRINITY_DN20748_c0_g1_i1.p1 TRINITY_DN20748_c0_g1~~TRINITY_DN20748_c0_g1_i1.p1  ORF type:complete len:179 (+),score=15.83 TRINITY_DN20748_c0_g1_i1:113-649(+)